MSSRLRYLLSVVGTGVLCMVGSLQATEFDFNWSTNTGDMTDPANWDPATNAPPINGATASVGGGMSAITANFDANLYSSPDTAPSEIRVLTNGTIMFPSNTNITQHNLVLDGGQLDGGANGRYHGTTTLVGDAVIGGGSILRMHGLIQEADPDNPSKITLTRWRTGFEGPNNNYSGGTIVPNGTELHGNAAGTLGYGDVEVLSGGDIIIQATLLRSSNAMIFMRTGSVASLVRSSSDKIVAEDGVTLSGWNRNGAGTDNSVEVTGTLTLVRSVHGDETTLWNQNWNGVFSDGDSAGKLVIEVQASSTNTNIGYIALTNNNTFTGGLELVDTRLQVQSAGNLGAGDVTLHANDDALLQLLHNDAINPNATLTLLEDDGVHGTVQLGADVTVLSLMLGSTSVGAGTYSVGNPTLGDFFTGTGSITVIPEPASLSLLAAGVLLMARRPQRSRHVASPAASSKS